MSSEAILTREELTRLLAEPFPRIVKKGTREVLELFPDVYSPLAPSAVGLASQIKKAGKAFERDYELAHLKRITNGGSQMPENADIVRLSDLIRAAPCF